MARERIDSPRNQRLQLVRKLASRRVRQAEASIVVEGEDLVHAGLAAGHALRFLLVDEDRGIDDDLAALAGAAAVCDVAPDLLAGVCELAHPPRVIGVFRHDPSDLPLPLAQPSLVLEAVHDPGNVGTAIRSAVALGIADVVVLPGCADVWSNKALRASMGATFRARIHKVSSADQLAQLHLVVFDADASLPVWDAALGEHPALCIGAERAGVSAELRALAACTVQIPFADMSSDSLNAGVAASLAVYEWHRQQTRGGTS